MTAAGYGRVLFVFGLQRVVELIYSRQNERRIQGRDVQAGEAGRSVWRWIVAVNIGLFTLPTIERLVRRRPAPRGVAAVGWVMALAGSALRLSVLATLRQAWNARAVVPADLQVIDGGPYRFIRHPNYVALVLEFAGLPLIGGAYVSGLVLSAANALLLWRRIVEEEALLMALPAYRERMAGKPRFVPRLLTGR